LPISSTVTLQKFSMGDWAFTITSPKPIAGPGAVAMLNMEVLVSPDATTPIGITSATFGKSASTLSQGNQGLVITQTCDTTAHVLVEAEPISVTQNSPNPFNQRATVIVTVRQNGHMRLSVYNSIGQQVLLPFDQDVTSGEYPVLIDASGAPSGTYHYFVEWSAYGVTKRETRSMSVVK
jgi:hypothetical protein